MRIAYFTHSLRSCWNHGNAHFLRGVLRELAAAGHDVQAYEPDASWSLQNLLHDNGDPDAWRQHYPTLQTTPYTPPETPTGTATENLAATLAPLIDGADLVIAHEWNDPPLIAALGALRRQSRFTLLFHDTHHRAASDPDAIRRYDLSGYDGVLAFGAALADIYRAWGWGDRVHVWHEAADTALFHPPTAPTTRTGAVWIGNWGDGERTAELEHLLLAPTHQANLPLTIHGVRYPPEARALLRHYGADYQGWLPNHRAPEIFAQHLLTIHVPRRYYASTLPGIPTIRVFEALACGIPLISAPWDDTEHLFTPGADYLTAHNGSAMLTAINDITHDPALRTTLAAHGLATIHARHTCAHRATELLVIVAQITAQHRITAQ